MSSQFVGCRGGSNDISRLVTDTGGVGHLISCLSLADGIGKVGVGRVHLKCDGTR